MTEDVFFTVNELAEYLKIKPITVYKHAEAGKLPSFKVGSKWRFRKSTIDSWIERQENNVQENTIQQNTKNTTHGNTTDENA